MTNKFRVVLDHDNSIKGYPRFIGGIFHTHKSARYFSKNLLLEHGEKISIVDLNQPVNRKTVKCYYCGSEVIDGVGHVFGLKSFCSGTCASSYSA